MNAGAKFRLIDWARDQRSGSAGADACLWRIAGISNSTGKCIMSDAAIARLCGRGERTITRYIAHLRLRGLIKTNHKCGRRVITFCAEPPSQGGCLVAPTWRNGRRQSGGQNPIRGILSSEAERVEYARLCNLPPSPKRLEALAAFARGGRDMS